MRLQVTRLSASRAIMRKECGHIGARWRSFDVEFVGARILVGGLTKHKSVQEISPAFLKENYRKLCDRAPLYRVIFFF